MKTATMAAATPYFALGNATLGPANVLLGIYSGSLTIILIGLFVTAMGVSYLVRHNART